MKIVMICDFFGDDQQYQENFLCNYYIKNGYEVAFITSTIENSFDYVSNNYDAKKSAKYYVHNKVKIYRLPYQINILNKLRRFKGVKKILREERPDLIFVHDIQLNLNDAVDYKIKFGARVIMDYHADYSNSAKNWVSLNILHKIIRKNYFNRYKNYIDEIFPIVPDGMKFLHEVYGVSYQEMELLPLGCDYDRCLEIKNTYDKATLRAEFGIDLKSKVIFTAGKLTPTKRTEVIVQALKILTDIDVVLVVAGTAADKDRHYFDLLKREAHGTKTKFFGWVNEVEMQKLMLISDIAVFPASQSVLWQQSIGMGLPLIVSNLGNQDSDYLNKENNVITLESGQIQPEVFAQVIASLFENPAKIDSMRKGAEKTAATFLNYQLIMERTLKIL